MKLGLLGGFAGGLASGYLNGREDNRRQAITDLAKKKDARDQQAYDQRQKSLKDLAGLYSDYLGKAGYHDLAKAINPDYVKNQAAANPDWEPGGSSAPPAPAPAPAPAPEAAPVTGPAAGLAIPEEPYTGGA